jgi:hypothetical protein
LTWGRFASHIVRTLITDKTGRKWARASWIGYAT